MSLSLEPAPPHTADCSTFSSRAETLRNFVAVFDQGVVSGTRFLATVMVGRICGQQGLGVYTVGLTFVLIATNVFDSLIATPVSVFGSQVSGARRKTYSGSALILTAVGATIGAIAFALLAMAALLLPDSEALAATLGAAALLMPAMFVVELLRRMAFVRLRVGAALAIDATACLLQGLGLVLLIASGTLSSPTAIGVWAVGFAIAAALGLACTRNWYHFDMREVRVASRQHWHFGRWAFASQLTLTLRSNLIPWFLALYYGTTATGAFAAFVTLVLLANPLLLGIGNSTIPAAAAAFADGQIGRVRRIVAQATAWCALATLALGITLLLGSDWLLALFYGNKYTVEPLVMALLAGGLVAEGIGIPPSNGLFAIGRPWPNFISSLAGLIVTGALAILLIGPLGFVGAACAFCLGRVATCVAQCWSFEHAIRQAQRLLGHDEEIDIASESAMASQAHWPAMPVSGPEEVA